MSESILKNLAAKTKNSLDSRLMLLKDLLKDYHHHLGWFFSNVKADELEKALQACCLCKGSLVFMGVGKSGVIAEKIVATLVSTGSRAVYLPVVNALHGDIGIVSDQDVVVCLSRSGASEELLHVIPYIKQKGAVVMSWVSKEGSKLARISDVQVSLPLYQELCPFNLAPTVSTAIQLVVGDLITVALMRVKAFSIEEYSKNHPSGAIGKSMLIKVRDVMMSGEDLPVCNVLESLRNALVILNAKQCGCLLLVDDHQQLCGVFTDGDLRRALQKEHGSVLDQSMADLMTCSYMSVASQTLATDALTLMQENTDKWVNILPVIDQGALVGLVRMHDLVKVGVY